MKVSIIIPVYNVYDYLRECVASVQKLKNDIEIILIDDGSTDDSGALCDELALTDNRIKVIHKENGGLSAARNTGIENANGEYLMFLDSDDFIDPVETDKILEKIDSGAELIMGMYRNYYTQDNRYEKEIGEALLQVKGLLEIDEFLKIIPFDGRSYYMTAWRFIANKDFVNKNQLCFMSNIYHEDEEWTQRAFCAAKKIFITHHYFYQYRQVRTGSITAKASIKHIRDRFTIIERFERDLRVAPYSEDKKEYTKRRAAQLYLGNMIDWHKLDKALRAEALSSLRGKRYLSKHLYGFIGTLVKISQCFIGVYATCCLLGLVDYFLGGKNEAKKI